MLILKYLPWCHRLSVMPASSSCELTPCSLFLINVDLQLTTRALQYMATETSGPAKTLHFWLCYLLASALGLYHTNITANKLGPFEIWFRHESVVQELTLD